MSKNQNKIRQTMVDCQIRTAGVIDPEVLRAFETVPREAFVPDTLKTFAYGDEELALGEAGRFLLEPRVHAKMLQALMLKPDQAVLDVGCGLGYSSAVLSSLVSTVVALESSEPLLQKAQHNWETHRFSNIIGVHGPLPEGYTRSAPYDAIFINGAVAERPDFLLSQLSPEGMLICVHRPHDHNASRVVLLNNNRASISLFDAAVPYLSGFEPKTVFQF